MIWRLDFWKKPAIITSYLWLIHASIFSEAFHELHVARVSLLMTYDIIWMGGQALATKSYFAATIPASDQ